MIKFSWKRWPMGYFLGIGYTTNYHLMQSKYKALNDVEVERILTFRIWQLIVEVRHTHIRALFMSERKKIY